MDNVFLSVVIPTKDRPERLRICLKSVIRNDYEDMEIIVSDNSETDICKNVVEELKDKRIKYYKTPRALGLTDSFEFAIHKATGNWIMMLGDKNFLYLYSIKKIVSCIEEYNNADIFNFPCDFFEPFDVNNNNVYGKLKIYDRSGKIEKIDCVDALSKHLSCKYLMCTKETVWSLGAVYGGGIYSRNFLEKIKKYHGDDRIFVGRVPDRYGAVEALCLADSVYYIGDNLVGYCLYPNNTWGNSVKKGNNAVKNMINGSNIQKKDIAYSIFRGIYLSVNNLIANDYYDALEIAKSHVNNEKIRLLSLDKVNLAAIISTELNDINNYELSILNDNKKILQEEIAKFSYEEKNRFNSMLKKVNKTFKYRFKMQVASKIKILCLSNNSMLRRCGMLLMKVFSDKKNSKMIFSLDELLVGNGQIH